MSSCLYDCSLWPMLRWAPCWCWASSSTTVSLLYLAPSLALPDALTLPCSCPCRHHTDAHAAHLQCGCSFSLRSRLLCSLATAACLLCSTCPKSSCWPCWYVHGLNTIIPETETNRSSQTLEIQTLEIQTLSDTAVPLGFLY
jgi:hypothetical protein